jgi:hypothetical protein
MSGGEPEFLTRADLESIHANSLHLFGGAMIAVANKQLNKSGLAMILRDAGKQT